MSAGVQQVVVDLVVLAAALWLVWSFGPERLRAFVTRRRAKPAYDAALHADGLDGRSENAGCSDGCGCAQPAGAESNAAVMRRSTASDTIGTP